MLDSVCHMTLELFYNHVFDMKPSRFYYIHNIILVILRTI